MVVYMGIAICTHIYFIYTVHAARYTYYTFSNVCALFFYDFTQLMVVDGMYDGAV